MDSSIPKQSSAPARTRTRASSPAPEKPDPEPMPIASVFDASEKIIAGNAHMRAIYQPPPPMPEPDNSQQAELADLHQQMRQPAMRGKAEWVFAQLARIFNVESGVE